MVGELGLAGVHGGKMQEADIDAAGLAGLQALVEPSQARRKAARGNRSSRKTEWRNACGFLTSAAIRWR